ncbi:hypothetical protein AB9Q10_23345 [Streptomyces krungchingensis]|uniref:hypothetical protein n=1 Tax=Streptomyces krungchingensis TaxID=1565034 RepID=UPI003CE94C61
MPADAADAFAFLDADTGCGRISNALKNDGTPGLTVRATTAYGDITARPTAPGEPPQGAAGMRGQEGQGCRVTGGGGRELGVREMTAVVADHGDVDGVGVGVDPAEHVPVRGVPGDC